MNHFHAGYIADVINGIITKKRENLGVAMNDTEKKAHAQRELSQLNGLLQHISSFDVEFPLGNEHRLNFDSLNPILATINNIISRGLPTRAPLLVEKTFESIGFNKKVNDDGEYNFFSVDKAISYETVFELMHIIEPHLQISRANYAGNLGSHLEWKFIGQHPFLKQIIQAQRDFSTINPKMAGGRSVDFSFNSLYLSEVGNKRGKIFEVDGVHHTYSDYQYYDKYRDDAAEEVAFETLRFSEGQINAGKINFERLLDEQEYKIFEKNYHRKVEDFKTEYALLFIPLAVARIQKTVIEYLLGNESLLNQATIKIAVIERDLPCGALAMQSLRDMIFNLNELLEEEHQIKVPDFEVVVFSTPKWTINEKFHLGVPTKDQTYFQNNKSIFDLIIDHAILRRSTIFKENDYLSNNAIKIRSSHYADTTYGKTRRVYCANLLNYKELVKKLDDGSYQPVGVLKPHIEYFVQNIFRKAEFRDGQLPIISRALQQKPVIGLLPTGGGKSLTFQLPAFMQPGLCLVVDPIKSLMEDQVRVLKENWIDCCDYINSNLKKEDKAKRLTNFRYGEIQFLFVSPERFVMEDFRKIIKNIDAYFGLAISYCVIDEVHCVSEWGHDFRTTYLMLGKNAQEFAKSRANKVTLLGLTATASFDVLADIERELQIQHDDVANAIIMIENTIRPELFFRVIDIDITKKDRIQALNEDFAKMGSVLAKFNDKELLSKSIEHHQKEFDNTKIEQEKLLLNEKNLTDKTQNDFFSIVFCPVKGTDVNKKGEIKNKLGVDFVFQNIASSSRGYFYSSDGQETELNKEVQKHFQDFIHGRTKHIVCTKAFGMGIDKKNIRTTYHYVYSSSLESFVQEAGRAGRDRHIGVANILVNTAKVYKVSALALLFESQQAFASKTESPISDLHKRKSLREDVIGKSFSSRGNLEKKINWGFEEKIKQRLLEFTHESYQDRGTHDFFFKNSFQGIDSEKSQVNSLFYYKEFYFERRLKEVENDYNTENGTDYKFTYWEKEGKKRVYVKNQGIDIGNINLIDKSIFPNHNSIIISVLNFLIFANDGNTDLSIYGKKELKVELEQETLKDTFNNSKPGMFDFMMAKDKVYPDAAKEICNKLGIDPEKQISPPQNTKTYREEIEKSLKLSYNYNDFILRLQEIENDINNDLVNANISLFRYYCYRDRNAANTGRLIYRMHSMGLLVDYTIDYKINGLHHCKFQKYNSIEPYIKHIKTYLRRYLSENSTVAKIAGLRTRLTKDTLIGNILECLDFLTEFAYEEIAGKRKRATDEIEELMNESVGIADFFEQNKHIKEEIFYYFNAKYARRGFMVSSTPFSLLDDYDSYRSNQLQPNDVLDKYLKVVLLDGAEQNNYKHLMGSCRKILRSLPESDLKKDWVLRLLRAFAMYAVNNPSYISEANEELESGFQNLFKDRDYHNGNFYLINQIFEAYFEQLKKNIDPKNSTFKDINLIQIKLMLEMQSQQLDILFSTHKTQKTTYHG